MNQINYEMLWGAIPYPAFMIANDDRIASCNSAAEAFAATSQKQMLGRKLIEFAGQGSAMQDVVTQARGGSVSVVLNDVELGWLNQPPRLYNLFAAHMAGGDVILLIHPRAMAEKMDRSLTHRSSARSVSGMAAMLAHEIRNPLAGISGAAQLLSMEVPKEDQQLTTLIVEETNRIGKLVDRVEEFGDLRPARREAVNIHDVLDRAKRAAEAGFAQHVRFVEEYDPSLPPVSGDKDQLSQVFQNLLKNAAEALGDKGVITLKTAYRPGVRMQIVGKPSISLPLEITIADNGPGIPDSIMNDIFDPFVSSKANGSGLGLALVSKFIADQGGVVECESSPNQTVFRLLLPVWREDKPSTNSVLGNVE